MNANSSLISIVQNGKDIYYFKIAKENQYDIFNLCTYDFLTMKETVVKSQKLSPKFDSQDEEMDAISVLIVKTDNFYSNRNTYDEDIDYLRFKQPYLAIIIYKSSNNKMVLSMRKLMDI